MSLLIKYYEDRLTNTENEKLTRTLQFAKGHDFCSNDYLGFAKDRILLRRIIKKLKNVALGSTGSRLISGYSKHLQELEEKLAIFSKAESTLYFTSAYQANTALISAIVNETCIVFSDEFNHASIIDAIKLTKAKKYIFKHRNIESLETYLKKYSLSTKTNIIIIEYLYSMDGDIYQLDDLKILAEKYNAYFIIDAAHATGIYDTKKIYTILKYARVLACVHSAGKALGISGGWIACSHFIKEYLINYSKPLIYSTAPSPLLIVALSESLDYHNEIGKLRIKDVLSKSKLMRKELISYVDQNNHGPIISLILGKSEIALKTAFLLTENNWHVRAIRPPTVPENMARLRITIKYANTQNQIINFASDIKKILADNLV